MLYAFKLGRKLRGEEPYCAEKGGKGGSSSSGAKEAARATQYAADLQNQQFNRVMEQLAPYAAAGLPLSSRFSSYQHWKVRTVLSISITTQNSINNWLIRLAIKA